ncbi:MAG: insulinase family protein, partial [Reyranellaceae bacterium]
GMSSRLFQRIREDRGLVYGIHCFNTAYADGGLFGIYAGTGEDDLAELVPAVCEEFSGVAGTLTTAELVRARNQIKAGTLMALESSGARCEQAARHLIIHGRPIPYAEIVSRIEAVDEEAVRRVAQRLLQGKLTIAALGPIDTLESIDQIAARLAA